MIPAHVVAATNADLDAIERPAPTVVYTVEVQAVGLTRAFADNVDDVVMAAFRATCEEPDSLHWSDRRIAAKLELLDCVRDRPVTLELPGGYTGRFSAFWGVES